VSQDLVIFFWVVTVFDFGNAGAQPNAQDPAEGTITLVGSTLDADQLRKRLQDVEKKCAEYRNALRNAHNRMRSTNIFIFIKLTN
jgi:hypothetical protein